MSVESLTIALHHSRAKGSAKLVLIGIANHDGDGGAWPTVATLMKYANVSRTAVQRAITELEALGEIKRFVQAGGDHRFESHERPNRYHVLLRCPADCDRTSQHRTRTAAQRVLDLDPEQLPDFDAEEGAASTRRGTGPHPRGGAAPTRREGATPTRPKPSIEPTTKDFETKPSNRARPKTPVWSDERCPGNWKHRIHEMGRGTGKCAHCHERPVAYADPTTGEVQ